MTNRYARRLRCRRYLTMHWMFAGLSIAALAVGGRLSADEGSAAPRAAQTPPSPATSPVASVPEIVAPPSAAAAALIEPASVTPWSTPNPTEPVPANLFAASGESTAAAATASTVISAGPTESASAPISEAEQVTRLERTIERDRQRVVELRAEFSNPSSEFRLAEAEFKLADEQFEAMQAELVQLKSAGDAAAIAAGEAALAAQEKKWKLIRERFDLAIQTKKTLQSQIEALEEKIRQDRQAYDQLVGPSVAPAGVTPTGAASTSGGANVIPAPAGDAASATLPAAPSGAAPTSAAPTSPAASTPATAPSQPTAAPASPAASLLPGVPGTGGQATSGTMPGIGASPPVAPKPVSKELIQAQVQAQLKQQEAVAAEQVVQSAAGRIAAVDKNIELERSLLAAARKKSDLVYQTRQATQAEYETKSLTHAPRHELEELSEKAHELDLLFQRAREEVRVRTDRVAELQAQRLERQREELAALNNAKLKQAAAEQATQKVTELQNPFAMRNLMQWAFDHGPKLAIILLAMLLLRWSARLASRRIVILMSRHGARGTPQEREDRAQTLVGVFHNAISVAIILGGVLMICEEIGIAVGPLMGGAAVFGLAVAFGAQNLIRDYFYGFVILLENQYKINDVLRIGAISGQVEQITLRMTVLRDLEGAVHFVPNGKIDSVTNLTHGWSRAVFDIGVAYKEDADHVIAVLLDIAKELRKDPAFAKLIVEDAEMLGVDSLADSAVVIKFIIKTQPLKQWAVKREMLRRIKREFDRRGIEIPYPHRTIYHRAAEGANLTAIGEQAAGDRPAEQAAEAWERKQSA